MLINIMSFIEGEEINSTDRVQTGGGHETKQQHPSFSLITPLYFHLNKSFRYGQVSFSG